MNSSYDSIWKKQMAWLQNGQKNWMNIFQKRTFTWPKENEKMLNIMNPQGNANQKHNEKPPNTCQNGYC